jgi:hypothetical protein
MMARVTCPSVCSAYLISLIVGTSPVAAQLYSEIPGITSSSVPYAGRTQSRTDFEMVYHRGVALPTGEWGAQARLAYGRSYRVFSNLELGLDLTFFDAAYMSRDATQIEGESATDRALIAGHAGYGVRFGGKYRIISSLTPWREGFEAAVFYTVQPQTRTGISLVRDGTDVWTGGLFRSPPEDEQESRELFHVPAASAAGIALGYRTRRVTVDAVLSTESSRPALNPAMSEYAGVYPRIGASYRVTGSLAIGAAYWGNGSPPWYAQGRIPGIEPRAQPFAIVVSRGSERGAGTDFVIAPPTGGQSPLRLFIRGRSSF